MADPNKDKAPKPQPAPAAKPEDKEPKPALDQEPPPADEPAPDGDGQPAPEEAPKEPVIGAKDPLLQSLFKDLGHEPVIAQVEDVDDDPKKADEPAKPEDKTPAPAEPEKPKPAKRKKSTILDEPPIPQAQPQAPVAQTPKPSEPAPQQRQADPDASYINTLTDEQKEDLAEAGHAERLMPEKYRGRTKKLIDWFKSLDSTIDRLRNENPQRAFDESDDEFNKFLRTKPPISPADSKKVQRHMAEEEVSAKVKGELEPRYAELERRQRETELKPEIDGIVKEVNSGINSILKQDEKSPLAEVVKTIETEGMEKAEEAFPLEVQVIRERTQVGERLTREYTRFARKLTSFDSNNPDHQWLTDFVNNQGDAFARTGGKRLVNDKGQKFLTRGQFAELAATSPEQLKNHWTLTHRDVLELIALNTTQEIKSTVEATSQRIQKLGFDRREKPKSALTPKVEEAPKPEPEPLNPPKAAPTRPRGPASRRADALSTDGTGIDVIRTLGYDK